MAHPEKAEYQQEDMTAGLRRQRNFVRTLTRQNTRFANQSESLTGIRLEKGRKRWLEAAEEKSGRGPMATKTPKAGSLLPLRW